MNALYYHGMPFNLEQKKTDKPNEVTVMGATVYMAEVVPALLKFSTFDRIYFPEIPSQYRDEAMSLPEVVSNRDRITFLPWHKLDVLNEPDSLTCMNPGVSLRHLAKIRDRIRRDDAPLSGVLHSVNHISLLENTLLEILAPLRPFDTLFASSRAGVAAMENQIRYVREYYGSELKMGMEYQPKLARVPLGVDLECYRAKTLDISGQLRTEFNLPEEAVVILYFGRLSARSKADLLPLILAFSRLPYAERNLYLLVAGDDTQLNTSGDIWRFAEMLGCVDNVRIYANPIKSAKHSLYRTADIFVSPSDSTQETFGLTLIEAMASSLPVIASDWDGYRDIVVDGETGMLIPTLMPAYTEEFDRFQTWGLMTAEDLLARTTVVDISHLFKALECLCVTPDIRIRFGAEGRRRVERLYGWKQVIAAYEAVWRASRWSARQMSMSGVKKGVVSRRAGYSYSDIFGHYASRFISLDDEVALSRWVREIDNRERLLEEIACPGDHFDSKMFEYILNYLSDGSKICIKHLLSKQYEVSQEVSLQAFNRESMILLHLARLLKYGLVDNLSIAKDYQ